MAAGDAEIRVGCSVHSPRAGAEIDPVQVYLEDLALAEVLLQPDCQQQLLHLAAQRPGVGQEQVFGHLLGQGRAALHHVSGDQVGQRGARQADHINAGVVPEAAVLHRHDGLRQVGRHVGQAERIAHHVAEAGEDMAGAVVQGQAGAARGVERRVRSGQVAREPQQHQRHREAAPYRPEIAQRTNRKRRRWTGPEGRKGVLGSRGAAGARRGGATVDETKDGGAPARCRGRSNRGGQVGRTVGRGASGDRAGHKPGRWVRWTVRQDPPPREAASECRAGNTIWPGGG